MAAALMVAVVDGMMEVWCPRKPDLVRGMRTL